MIRIAMLGLAAMSLLCALPAGAADMTVAPAPQIVAPSQEVLVPAPPAPGYVFVEGVPEFTLPPAIDATPLPRAPQIHFGCQRLWRCDAVVCGWRRGCWGVYGYVEGPYYTKRFAERQWEGQNLPTRRHHRRHVAR